MHALFSVLPASRTPASRLQPCANEGIGPCPHDAADGDGKQLRARDHQAGDSDQRKQHGAQHAGDGAGQRNGAGSARGHALTQAQRPGWRADQRSDLRRPGIGASGGECGGGAGRDDRCEPGPADDDQQPNQKDAPVCHHLPHIPTIAFLHDTRHALDLSRAAQAGKRRRAGKPNDEIKSPTPRGGERGSSDRECGNGTAARETPCSPSRKGDRCRDEGGQPQRRRTREKGQMQRCE